MAKTIDFKAEDDAATMWGDKREKVKILKHLFTISYKLSLFPATEKEPRQIRSASFDKYKPLENLTSIY